MTRDAPVKTSPKEKPLAPTIAIVGGGLSGALVAVQLLRNAQRPLAIKVIEAREHLGRGIAYSTRVESHLLNVPAANMSAFPDQPSHFLDWLRGLDHSANAYSFVSRSTYGDYIEAMIDDAKRGANPAVSIEHLRDRAVRIRPDDRQVEIFLGHGGSLTAQFLVLAYGNGAAANPLPRGSDVEAVSAWSPEAVEGLSRDATVMLIGSGLTAIDVCLSLLEQKHTGAVYMVSRHGLIPRAHTASPAATRKNAFGAESARGLLGQIRRLIDEETAGGGSWHSVIDSVRPHANDIWRRLPAGEKSKWLRHLRPRWEVHRHRMAIEVAAKIEAMRERGQLRILAGRIIRVAADSAGEIAVQIRTGSPARTINVGISRLINCTGPRGDPRTTADPLIAAMLDEGIARADALSLGIETTDDGRLHLPRRRAVAPRFRGRAGPQRNLVGNYRRSRDTSAGCCAGARPHPAGSARLSPSKSNRRSEMASCPKEWIDANQCQSRR